MGVIPFLVMILFSWTKLTFTLSEKCIPLQKRIYSPPPSILWLVCLSEGDEQVFNAIWQVVSVSFLLKDFQISNVVLKSTALRFCCATERLIEMAQS